MFDFGDELTVESYRVPWLIWIQVFVTLLLILLLYFLAFTSLDPTDNPNPNSSSSSSSSSSRFVSKDRTHTIDLTAISNHTHHTQVGEIRSLKGEIAAGTSRRAARREDIGGDQLSAGESGVDLHPCYYVRLARMAFLKCFGLDSSSENSPNRHGRKKKEE